MKQFPASQHALLSRLGLKGALSIDRLADALRSGKLMQNAGKEPSSQPGSITENDTISYGNRLLSLFAKEYLKARFPRLPISSVQLGVQMYQDTRNLSVIARSLGIDYGVENKFSAKDASDYYAALYKSILGSLFMESVCMNHAAISFLFRDPFKPAHSLTGHYSMAAPLTRLPCANHAIQ